MIILCAFEVDILRVCAGGTVEGFGWGAAVSVALESLSSAGLIAAEMRQKVCVYVATDAGRALLTQLDAQHTAPPPDPQPSPDSQLSSPKRP